MSHDRFIPPEEVMDIISRVSADDIRKLANDTIASAGASLALISPDVAKGDEDRLRDLLRRL
jgi:hypothetical protein